MTSSPQTGSEPTELRREFSLWSAFAFAFAFISPIVAMYGIYGLSLATAGPGFWWTFVIVGVGQCIVALAFAELVSRWPYEGSIYQWTRRLAGEVAGWLAGWVYMWALVIIMATVAYGGAGFLAQLIGIEQPTAVQQSVVALLILLAGTGANILGRGFLKALMFGSIIAEIVASIGLGTYLLIFHRHHGIDAILHGIDLNSGWSWAYVSGPFLAALAFTGWSILGFESAGAIAEEVKEPRRNVPKAMLFSIAFIALVIAYASLAVTLAVPDFEMVRSGEEPDPVAYVLSSALGEAAVKPILLAFVIGFLASFLALQASGSRVIWSFARDKVLPGHRVLSKLSKAEAQPIPAILVTTVIGAFVYLISATDVYSVLVTFTAGGYYLAFLFPLVTGLVARLRGTWVPGPWNLGRFGTPVAVLAVAWVAFEFTNIVWPRTVSESWYMNWAFFVAMGVILAVGVVILKARNVGGRSLDDSAEAAPSTETELV
ncbi:APC family permease [Mycolicibacterium litorale]|uniref:Amino acid permease n=1 Tax=Mycolicibacterium litorale TaxID=758802 RepID=A0AAD1IJ68_9MYCO|nr:APC family permease [Mycolicibacterium litorale]MCV7415227.1 amino acid permease [Mycolicibacterium litorale]TDY08481.1 amino acid/polyamine/organocation transporter (APC superfamily) [Mycolicibacterium litorale]BBY16404.1 amino acid permease [Mycolicibacterium litorale]